MDQTRKRRVNNRKAGLSHCKLARAEVSEENRDVLAMRATSPEVYSKSQQQQDCCSKKLEDVTDLIISCEKEQPGTRAMGRRKCSRRQKHLFSDVASPQKNLKDGVQPEVEIDQELDRELENKSRQHNLTSANVRSIIHEVITNEHVVAMMKAAISETEPVPMFEPKMTRSKLKEVVEKGVVIPAWNISPIKKPAELKRGPQFVDIPLEEEDSSDEEYQPDEEEEEETAEETFLESDLDNSSCSPWVSRVNIHRSFSECEEDHSSVSRPNLLRPRHLMVAATPMGPPLTPDSSKVPQECSFLEKLHAVDEELAIGLDCMDSFQGLSGTNGEENLISFRTRSKHPLRDVSLGRLEAELRAPDITPDMYEFGSAPEDREWTQWLQSLMISDMDNEEEGDDEDDPEYNFLAEIDEPDVEDYRNDKAVRITKKEVNDLMEELFDAFQDDLGVQEEEEEKVKEESPLPEPPPILEDLQYNDPLADILKQRYKTVREQLEALRNRKAHLERAGVSIPPACPQKQERHEAVMTLSTAQKLQLQQQIQQHVQLLTEVNMLSSSVQGLETEASTTRQFLLELQMFAHYGEQTCGRNEKDFTSIFKACNLQELLPTVHLRPFKFKAQFSSAEDCLIVLGHKHLRGTLNPLQMTCEYLLAARSVVSLKPHIRDACRKPFPNVIKTYFVTGKCSSMPLACKRVSHCHQRPAVEREEGLLPDWLSKNLKRIHEHVRLFNNSSAGLDSLGQGSPCIFPPGTRYPPNLPKDLAHALKVLATSQSSKDTAAKPPKSMQPPPVAKKLEVVLSQFPTILPKSFPGLNAFHSDPGQNMSLLPIEDCSSPAPASVVPLEGCSLDDGVTSPTAPRISRTNSSKLGPVKNVVEPVTDACGSPKSKTASQRDVIITLPAATECTSFPNGIIGINPGAQLVTCTVKPAIPTTTNLIVTFQPAPVTSVFLCPAPMLSKDSSGQQSKRLRKIKPKDSSDQNPQNQVYSSGGTIPNPTEQAKSKQKRIVKRSSAQKCTGIRKQEKGHVIHVPPQIPDVHSAPDEFLPETMGFKEKTPDDECGMDQREEEHYELSLTLSESSGSPAPSVDEEDANLEMGMNLEEQNNVEREGSRRVSNISEIKDTVETFLHLVTKAQKEGCSKDETQHEPSGAQPTPTTGVYEVLHPIPEKLHQFLFLLSGSSKDPDQQTSLELLTKLKPVLEDWPELLQDFAAFLHPDQARECGLLAEQQAFERSRWFLLQLESTFGEQSDLYRKVVHMLQGDQSQDLDDFEEMKAEMALLFQDRTDLLEQFWEYYKQLQMQGDGHVQRTNQSMEGSQVVRTVVQGEEMGTCSQIMETKRNKVKKKDKSSSEDGQHSLFNSIGNSVCAKNISHTPAGKKVILWTSSLARGRSDVLELKDADFDYLAPEHETLLVKFYAPWCGHCKKLAPEFESAATQLKGTVTLAKVDCTSNRETCKRYSVNGYPTLIIFRNGQESSSYNGPRSADGIVNYMENQAGPDSVSLQSRHDLESFLNHFDASVVGFFSGAGSPQLAEFLKGAGLMRESFRFAHTTDLELGKNYGVTSESILLFRPPRLNSKFEESVIHHTGSMSVTGLRRFIKDNIYGLCPHMTRENSHSLRKRDLLTAYYEVDYLHNPKGSNYWRNRVLKVASKFSSRGLLLSVANRNDFIEELVEEFGLSASDGTELPFVTIRTRTGQKYTMREEFTRDGVSLESFLENYFAGRLKQYTKSEPVPVKNNGAVKVVVADTFEEIVHDPEKDVLIEFYAPWCAHCKKLEPKYTELGEKLHNEPNVVIAKMDATANDAPQGYEVQGHVSSTHHSADLFPTIYFAAAGRKDKPIKYEGPREVKDFISFLKREATNRLFNGGKEEL
ncbi:hypothetical protein DNTS_033244 [Danionella cerebrum]|uniref:Protein disulfide-isomerase n=1 Tax=Danionella cerebrum TaxID=2873325 RepID=A0A553RGP0_9TELE|nr:hypothetical protein DNTS_033244 [Danionella translucida]